MYLVSRPAESILETGLNASEIIIVVSGFVLAWGAAGEYLDEHEHLTWLPSVFRWPKLVFVLMVAISLAFEFIGDAGVYICSSRLQILEGATIKALDSKATEAGRKAEGAITSSDAALGKASGASEVSQKAYGTSGEAMRVARGARQEADTFEKDIADARRDASEAKSLLAEVRRLAAEAEALAAEAERKVADRHVTPAQLDRIHKSLARWNGQDIRLYSRA